MVANDLQIPKVSKKRTYNHDLFRVLIVKIICFLCKQDSLVTTTSVLLMCSLIYL